MKQRVSAVRLLAFTVIMAFCVGAPTAMTTNSLGHAVVAMMFLGVPGCILLAAELRRKDECDIDHNVFV